MFISSLIGPISSHNGENRDNQKMQGRTTDERNDLDQETTPPKTTNSITRIPHLIWVMGKLSFLHYISKNVCIMPSRRTTDIHITFVKHMF